MADRDNPVKRLTGLRAEAWSLVKNFPGIRGIGIGLKEVGGIKTRQLAWRLYVEEKLPVKALPPRYVLPSALFGFPTDVLPKVGSRPAYGNDTVELLRPGVEIKSDVSSGGTLGCFAIRSGQPDKIVILSNSHVIYGDSASLGVTSDPDVGQPKVSCSWCCKCKVIGNAKRADARNAFGPWVETQVEGFENQRGVETDCAIADFNRERDYTNEIENVGMITGTPPEGNLGLTAGASVDMIGSTSGHVKGKVLSFTFNASIAGGPSVSNLLYPLTVQGNSIDENFAGVFPNINQFLFIPDPDPADPDRKMYFARHGDSGSVIVNSERQVVALLSRAWFISPEGASFLNSHLSDPIPAHVGSMGLANPIHPVLNNLNIEIPNNLQGTKVSSGATITVPSSFRPGETVEADANLWLSHKADELEAQLKAIPLGKQLAGKIQQHRPEVFRLVNFNRAVTVTWHRCQGPAFVAHCLKNVKDPAHQIPRQVDGISRELLLKRMAAALKENGSEALGADIDLAYSTVIRHINDADTLHEMMEVLKSLSAQPVFKETGGAR